MSFDNRVFNVNGADLKLLQSALYFAFNQSGHETAKGWRITPDKGFILYWAIDEDAKDITKFPGPLCSDTIVNLVKDYLRDEDTWKNIKLDGWDADIDQDGDNGKGWRVYCEDWGHIDGDWRTFIAIKPVYIWYGK